MKCYERATKAVHQLVSKVMKDWHEGLAKAGVSVDVIFVADHDAETGAMTDKAVIKWGGKTALACVRINSLKHRVMDHADIEIEISEHHWKNKLNDEQRLAVIDHELAHVECVTDQDGHVREDDAGRPRVKLRAHDWIIGGFDAVVHRHRKNSIEAMQVLKVLEDDGQYILPFATVGDKTKAPTRADDKANLNAKPAAPAEKKTKATKAPKAKPTKARGAKVMKMKTAKDDAKPVKPKATKARATRGHAAAAGAN